MKIQLSDIFGDGKAFTAIESDENSSLMPVIVFTKPNIPKVKGYLVADLTSEEAIRSVIGKVNGIILRPTAFKSTSRAHPCVFSDVCAKKLAESEGVVLFSLQDILIHKEKMISLIQFVSKLAIKYKFDMQIVSFGVQTNKTDRDALLRVVCE